MGKAISSWYQPIPWCKSTYIITYLTHMSSPYAGRMCQDNKIQKKLDYITREVLPSITEVSGLAINWLDRRTLKQTILQSWTIIILELRIEIYFGCNKQSKLHFRQLDVYCRLLFDTFLGKTPPINYDTSSQSSTYLPSSKPKSQTSSCKVSECLHAGWETIHAVP